MRSMKTHLKCVVATVKLTFEDFVTVLTQIEACLSSRPLVPFSCDNDGADGLTPGHFLIGWPLQSFPDPGSPIVLSPSSVADTCAKIWFDAAMVL